MNFVVTGLILLLGLGARYAVDLSAELSNGVFLDSDSGIVSAGSLVTSDPIVDMRPETAVTDSAADLPDLLPAQQQQ